ncbi:MAG: serine/threonine protein phosphatase [Desulfobacterales bacterium]|jgi:serine/threonine protein phosphatase 1|nr:serine/threonine protein phosphatase [Desulfobacteraceae bacterium]MBT4364957.1 serine/threonine protein phosphatase [Desulfobacteraceae bacterium]MBT7086767.1 serine/threonine protein phosphatase [Desulfobacterales bacterium]MBT7696084.1 serine/threonine protein phosphatase [Desulfobacterales bacterium]
MERIFAFGDIHGCFNKLCTLVDMVDINSKKDTVVFIGDYIDRGKESYEVVDYLINLKSLYKNIVFLKGNHESLLLDYLQGRNVKTFLENGGRQTLESYNIRNFDGDDDPIPPSHMEFFSSLKLYHETEEFIFVHAGLKDNVALEDQVEADMLWIRKPFINSDFDFGRRVVFGHTPVKRPLVHSNKIGIDTGAVFGNKLTCVELPDMNFYSV